MATCRDLRLRCCQLAHQGTSRYGGGFQLLQVVSTGDSVLASDSEDVGPLNMNVKLVDASAEGAADIIRTTMCTVLLAPCEDAERERDRQQRGRQRACLPWQRESFLVPASPCTPRVHAILLVCGVHDGKRPSPMGIELVS